MHPIIYSLALSIFALTPSCGFSQQPENTKPTVDEEYQVVLNGGSNAAEFATEPNLKSDAGNRKMGDPTRFGPGLSATKNKDELQAPEMPIFRYVMSIAAIIALMIGVLWAMNKLNRHYSGSQHGSLIRLTNRVHLDNKNSLALVHVGDQELLIGIGVNGMTLLHKDSHLPLDQYSKPTND